MQKKKKMEGRKPGRKEGKEKIKQDHWEVLLSSFHFDGNS